MNIAVRGAAPRRYCTRTQHIELRVAKADDAERIARLFGEWFPTSIWADCLTYDPVRAAGYIRRGIETGCEPFILAFENPPQKFSHSLVDRNLVHDRNTAHARAIDGDCAHVTASDDAIDNLVGLISWHLDGRFTEPIGVLDEVFVIPRLRRSDLGARLIHYAVHISKMEGARVFNFPVASGMPEQKSLINMLANRFDAEPVGVILRKVL